MTGRHDVHDELRARLREAAGGHEPDRARILARVERGMAESEGNRRPAQRQPVLGWARVVGATAAVAGVLAVGGYAAASALKDDDPAQQTVAVTPTPESSDPSPERSSRAPLPPDPTPRPDKPTPTPSATGKPRQSAPVVTPPAGSGVEDGPLWSDGSVDPHSNEFWAQSNVTVKTDRQLTSLTVELRIKQTGGVTSAGAWRSLPEDDFALTVGERDGFLVYTWVLQEGRTVPAGEFVFAGQYDHERGGRDARGDRYAITARDGGQQLGVQGDFASQDTDNGDS